MRSAARRFGANRAWRRSVAGVRSSRIAKAAPIVPLPLGPAPSRRARRARPGTSVHPLGGMIRGSNSADASRPKGTSENASGVPKCVSRRDLLHEVTLQAILSPARSARSRLMISLSNPQYSPPERERLLLERAVHASILAKSSPISRRERIALSDRLATEAARRLLVQLKPEHRIEDANAIRRNHS
jgi:hypothetical protein